MSKVLAAECAAGVVQVEGLPIADCEVLSQGTKPSEGIVVLDQDKSRYLTGHAEDLAEVIESLDLIFQQVIAILTALDGVSTSPGTVTAAVAALTLAEVQFALMKESLR